MTPHPKFDQVQLSMSSESYHPYGNGPEDHGWDPTCLADFSHSEFTCNLIGTNAGSNFKSAARYNLQNQIEQGWRIEQNITETGRATTDQLAKARFVIRQYLLFQALGIPRINFYRLADNGVYGFVDAATQTPFASYWAIQGLVSDAAAVGLPPLPYGDGDLPSVLEYCGSYPLTTMALVGTRAATDLANTVLYVTWQRSYPAQGDDWLALPSPAPVPLTVQLPAGMSACGAHDLVTRTDVPIEISEGGQVLYEVADNPVSLRVAPDCP